MNDTYVLQMEGIEKEYSGVKVLRGIDLQVRPGEVVSIVGENGAGKSTLMNILFGMPVIHSTGGFKGSVRLCGEEVRITSPEKAIEFGIGMVHQEFMLLPNFTVAENIKINRENTRPNPLSRIFGRQLQTLDVSQNNADARVALDKMGMQSLDERTAVEGMPVGYMQFIECAREIDKKNIKLIVFDEPTAVLTPQEIEELMQIMKNLAAEGKSILFISHKLNEIMEVSDRVTVLRKGKCIGTVETASTTAEELSAMMVGRNVSFHVEKGPLKPGGEVLSVEHLTVASKVHKNNAVKDVSFRVRAGEIVCIAGIDGNGQTELVYALTGLEPAVSGKITLEGKDITHASIRQRSLMGMSHIPEDRHKHGLVLDYTLEDNMVLQRYFEPEFTDKAGFLRRKNIRAYAEGLIEQYDVRAGQGPVTPARSMSGGNQQKAIVAREIDKHPELLVAVQPTRGLDVGAIEYIHKQLVAQRDAGKAVLLVSLELDEVMDVPDRILVMYEGEIVGELDPKSTTQEELGLYMAGAKRDEVKA